MRKDKEEVEGRRGRGRDHDYVGIFYGERMCRYTGQKQWSLWYLLQRPSFVFHSTSQHYCSSHLNNAERGCGHLD